MTSSLNYITKKSEIQAENCVCISENFFIIQLLKLVIRDKSPPLLPSSYATVINNNNN